MEIRKKPEMKLLLRKVIIWGIILLIAEIFLFNNKSFTDSDTNYIVPQDEIQSVGEVVYENDVYIMKT